jgi:hypothetical protein
MNLISKLIIAFSLLFVVGCTSNDMRVEYSYPKSLDERERDRIGSRASEPVYLFREKTEKHT